jgi:gluconate 2-dehydrogenase gamma chain
MIKTQKTNPRNMKTRLSRRTFVTAGALSAAVPPVPAATTWQFFTPPEAALVDALCEQIVPADEFPGARQAGTVHYIDRQLAGPLKRFGKTYRAALPKLDQSCLDATGKKFLDLPPPEQTRFLESVEKGEIKTLAAFFNMLVDHTMQGFYGDPKHGGNAGAASWKMLGIENVMAVHAGHKTGEAS